MKVPWYRIVAPEIPKHNLIAWMVFLNRLPTKDRLIGWGMNADPICLLCQAGDASARHLFFECNYTLMIWRDILKLCNMQIARVYDIDSILRLAWKACIYHVWKERNKRLHSSIHEASDVVCL